jgi:hypothetical protein
MVVNVPKLHTLSEPRFRALLTEGSAHVLFHYNGYLTEPGALMRESYEPFIGSKVQLQLIREAHPAGEAGREGEYRHECG